MHAERQKQVCLKSKHVVTKVSPKIPLLTFKHNVIVINGRKNNMHHKRK